MYKFHVVEVICAGVRVMCAVGHVCSVCSVCVAYVLCLVGSVCVIGTMSTLYVCRIGYVACCMFGMSGMCV